MSKLASLLGGMTLNDLAKEVLSLQGRRGDTELAHVNKREAALLKAHGGAGDVNPSTGMTEYYDLDTGPYDQGGYDIGQPSYDPTVMPADVASGEFADAALKDYYNSINMPADVASGQFADDALRDYYSGQPPTQVGGAQGVSPPQEISGFPEGLNYDPGANYSTGRLPGAGVQDVLGFTQGVGIEGQGTSAGAAQPTPGIMDELERLAKAYPTASRAALAAALGIPGMVRGNQARQDAARTRREMEQMAAPIRAVGQEQLAAGQRGELTPTQQQQLQVARAAARQDLARRGVTSGTAAQMAENRITEMAQRFAQTNIENGVRLIGAANSYNAAAIQQAYKMNQDANAMTTAYFQNLMRAFGALPTETVTTTRTA